MSKNNNNELQTNFLAHIIIIIVVVINFIIFVQWLGHSNLISCFSGGSDNNTG